MKNKFNKIARDTNLFLIRFLTKQKKTDLIKPMKYGLLPGGKKIRSKLIVDIGKIFKIKYQILIQIGAAVECIHAYSLIHDDLPCMDNDLLRRGRFDGQSLVYTRTDEGQLIGNFEKMLGNKTTRSGRVYKGYNLSPNVLNTAFGKNKFRYRFNNMLLCYNIVILLNYIVL